MLIPLHSFPGEPDVRHESGAAPRDLLGTGTERDDGRQQQEPPASGLGVERPSAYRHSRQGNDKTPHFRGGYALSHDASFATAATLPEMLKKCGYVTVHCGKAHFGTQGTPGSNPLNMGFDYNIAGTEIGHPADYRGSRHYGKGFNHVRGLDENNYYQDDILTEALAREAIKRLEAIRTNPRRLASPLSVHGPLRFAFSAG